MRWPSWPKFVCIRMALPCSHRTERISSEANGRESRVTMSEGKKKESSHLSGISQSLSSMQDEGQNRKLKDHLRKNPQMNQVVG